MFGSGIIQRARGTFNHMQVLGVTWLRTQTPPAARAYIGQAGTTSWGMEMAASGDTTIDFTTPGNKSKGRILHDNLFSIILLYVN